MPNARSVPSYDFSTQKVNIQRKFTNCCCLWQNVTKWCREFSEGRTDIHHKQRRGRPSLISDDLLQENEGEIHANQHVTITESHHIISEVSETTFHEAVTEKLGYRKLCAHWVVQRAGGRLL
jgi:hypothetical protein